MKDFILYLLDLFYAWRRNERRTHPRGVKGRVYEKKASPGGAMPVKSKFKGTLRPTGYYSAAEDRWYDIDKNGKRTPREKK